jgi:hypothetical protein
LSFQTFASEAEDALGVLVGDFRHHRIGKMPRTLTAKTRLLSSTFIASTSFGRISAVVVVRC